MGIKRIPHLATRRNFKDSGVLQQTNNTTISSGAVFIFVLDERFKPYDDVTTINLNSDNDCTLSVNGNTLKQPLPKGNSVKLNHENVETIRLTNNGSGTIAVDEIQVYYRNTGHKGKAKIQKASTVLSGLGNISLIKSFFKK